MGRKARAKRAPRDKGGLQSPPRHAMRRRTKRLAGVVLALLVVAGGVGGWLWYGARATPEAAPHFNLLASTGQRIALTDYMGQQEVVLLFYMGTG
ncbi:MAG: hypothetical protein ACRERE_24015 [Candidatus Entotheonellia bacterium]